MKYIVVALISLFVFISPLNAHHNGTSAKTELSQVKNGSNYIQRIDSFISKYSENRQVLERLQLRLQKLESSITSSNNEVLQALVHYLLSEVDTSLLLLTELEKKQMVETILETISSDIIEDTGKEPDTATTIPKIDFSKYDNNSYDILAGESAIVYKAEVSSRLESVEVGEVIFTFIWNNIDDIEETIQNASLYIWDKLITTNVNSDIRQVSGARFRITFDNLDNLIVTENPQDLRLIVHTAPIWFQKLWQVIPWFRVEQVVFSDAEWLTSNQNVASFTLTERWDEYFIAPTKLDVEVTRSVNTSLTPKFRISANIWDNTLDNSNGTPNITLDQLSFDIWASNFSWSSPQFVLQNEDGSWGIPGTLIGNRVVFNLSGLDLSDRIISGNDSEDFEIIVNGLAWNATLFLELQREGITYSIDGIARAIWLQTHFENDIDFWSRAFR